MVSIKTVTNADTGTADIVGGDDWDAMATYVNDISLHNPRTSSYVITKEGSTTYARHGLTNAILSQNSDSDVVIQAAIDALPTSTPWGGGIFIKYSPTEYSTDTKLNIPGQLHGVKIEMENPYTSLTYSGTDACIEVGDTGTQTIGFQLIGGRIQCTSTSGNPVGLRLINLNHTRLYTLRINGVGSTAITGIELNGGANFNGDIQMYGPYISGALVGIKTTNGAANAICIFGGSIIGTAGPVASSYGIDKDGGDTWQVYGLDIENYETAIRERALDGPYGSSIFDVRVESCTNYVTTATSNNRYGGSTTSTIITDTGTLNDYTAPAINKLNQVKVFQNYTDNVAMAAPSSPATGTIRSYVKTIDANNDGIFIKRRLNGAVVEVQIG